MVKKDGRWRFDLGMGKKKRGQEIGPAEKAIVFSLSFSLSL